MWSHFTQPLCCTGGEAEAWTWKVTVSPRRRPGSLTQNLGLSSEIKIQDAFRGFWDESNVLTWGCKGVMRSENSLDSASNFPCGLEEASSPWVPIRLSRTRSRSQVNKMLLSVYQDFTKSYRLTRPRLIFQGWDLGKITQQITGRSSHRARYSRPGGTSPDNSTHLLSIQPLHFWAQ